MKKALLILLLMPLFASSQTFEKIIPLNEISKPYCLIETHNGFLITVNVYKENYSYIRQSKLLKINAEGDIINKTKLGNYYMQTITTIWNINDTTYGALGYATPHADSTLKIVYYHLNKELKTILLKEYNTIIDIESELISDICFNKNNNLVYQLSFFFKDYTQNGYYFVEYSNNGICIKDTFIPANNYPTKACITTNKDSGYFFFDGGIKYTLNKELCLIDTFLYYPGYPEYYLISDVIWENDSTLIMSIPYNSENSFYYMGISRAKWGKEIIKDMYYDWNELYEMYAYYNSFDISGNQYFLAATTNFNGGSYFDHDTTGIRIIKVYNDFSINWDKTYRRDTKNFLYYIKATRDGGCIVAGTRYDFSKPERKLDLYLLKVDSLGNYTSTDIAKTALRQSHMSLYPNPGNNEINLKIQGNNKTAIFSLYNISGKKVLSKQANAAQTTITTEQLPTGLYIYELRKNGVVLDRGKWVKR